MCPGRGPAADWREVPLPCRRCKASAALLLIVSSKERPADLVRAGQFPPLLLGPALGREPLRKILWAEWHIVSMGLDEESLPP